MRLLVIEDEEDMLRALCLGLRKNGYVVDAATNGPEGLRLAQLNSYDLIVLDLNLPGMDGMAVLKEIRAADKERRIIILSARADFSQRILGLDSGANDYLVKPFDFGELMARIRSLLRRNWVQQDAVVTFSSLAYDTVSRRLQTAQGEVIPLPPKELAVLEYLLLNRARPVTMEELIEHVWESDDSLFSNTVKVHVSTLRKRLAPYVPGEVILWTRGQGYLIKGES